MDRIDLQGLRPHIRHAPQSTQNKVPRLLRMTAKELAGAFYEEAKRSDIFRKTFPTWRTFVPFHWPEFVKPAREVLLTMLRASTTTEHVKKEIYAAITNDFEERTKDSFKGLIHHG